LGQVFLFKLGSFYVMKEVLDTNTGPCLKLKTRRRFCPPSLSLPLMKDNNWKLKNQGSLTERGKLTKYDRAPVQFNSLSEKSWNERLTTNDLLSSKRLEGDEAVSS